MKMGSEKFAEQAAGKEHLWVTSGCSFLESNKEISSVTDLFLQTFFHKTMEIDFLARTPEICYKPG